MPKQQRGEKVGEEKGLTFLKKGHEPEPPAAARRRKGGAGNET